MQYKQHVTAFLESSWLLSNLHVHVYIKYYYLPGESTLNDNGEKLMQLFDKFEHLRTGFRQLLPTETYPVEIINLVN